MRKLKWIALAGLILALLLVGGLFVANWYVGVHGLPTSVEDKIRAEAEKQGVTLEFANARLINLERLELLDVVVSDSADWELLNAERITVWLEDVLDEPRATGAEIVGHVRVPLTVNGEVKTIHLKHLHLHALVTPEHLRLASFHAELGSIELRVSGGLSRDPPPSEPKRKDDGPKPGEPAEPKAATLDIAALTEGLSPTIRRAIDEVLEVCEPRNGHGKLELQVDGSLADLAACTVDFDVHLAGLLARGVSVDTFAANGRYQDNNLDLTQLYLGFDGDELLRGNATLADGKLGAELALRVYPEKVARVLNRELPEAFPSFGAPVDAELRLEPTTLDALKSCAVSGTVGARDVQIYDGHIHQATATFDYHDESLSVTQLFIGFGGDESLRGSATFAHDKLAADLALRVYPEKLARLCNLELPDTFPAFRAPVVAQLQLQPTALDAFKDCEVSGSFSARDFKVLHGELRRASATIAYRNRELYFDGLEAELASGVRITTTGSYNVDKVRIALEANILGHPGFIADFSKSERFRSNWARIWSRFEFSPESPPRFIGNLQWQKGWPDVNAQLRGEWSNVAYNGVFVDRATSAAVYDGPDKVLLLRNLQLHREGRWLRGNLAWLFRNSRLERERSKIEFEATSSLGSGELFELVGLPWGQSQTEAGRHVPLAYTAARGEFHFGAPEQTVLRLYSTLPSGHYGSSKVESAILGLDLNGRDIVVEGALGKLQTGDWTLADTRFEYAISPDTRSLAGDIETVQAGIGLTLRNSQFDTVFEDDKITSLTGSCASVEFQETLCQSVEGKVDLLDDGRYAISARAEQGKIRDFQGAGLTVSMEISKAETRAEFASDKLELPDVAVLNQAKGKFMFRGAQKVFRINAASARQLNGDARTQALTISGTNDGDDLDIRFDTPKLFALENGELDGVSMRVKGDGARMTHSLSIDKLRLGDTLAASSISGEGPWLRHSFSTRFKAAELKALDLPFRKAAGNIAWTSGHLSLSHLNADLFGGKAEGSAFYSTADQAGSTWWTLDDLALGELSAHFGKKPEPDNSGDAKPTLDGNVNLSMSGWGDSLSLHGNGHLSIKDGNFVRYRVPIVSDFLTLVSKSPIGLLNQLNPLKDLGKISKMRTDLIFENDRILIPNLRSNGDVIAISADGYYRWKDPWIEIRLRAGSLPGIWKHIPLVSDPFEVLLERKAIGPPKDYKWEEITGIRELFQFNKKDNKDP